MVCQPVRLALLLGAITAVAVSPARADDKAPSTTKPCTRTITCTEYVPEYYTKKVTRHRYECRTEEVDGFRCESVPVERERTVCCVRRVPVEKEVTRKVCCNVTTYEERTVMRTCYKTVEKTVMQKKCVSRGHWECREVCGGGLFDGCNLFGGGCNRGCGDGCNRGCNRGCNTGCDRGCNTGCNRGCGSGCHTSCRSSCDDPCKETCRPVRTRKVWVSCPEYVDCPVKVCERVCVQEPVKCKVAVCKQEWKEEKVKVCTYECREEKRVEKYTVCETRKVPCKVKRTVRVCVPYEEEVKCCRMVAKTVTREVPVVETCCEPCAPRCGLFSGCNLFGGCNRGCDSGCHTSCRTSCHTSCRPSCDRGCDRGCGSGCNLFGGCNRGCDRGCGSGCNLFGGGCGHRSSCCN